MDKVGVSDHDTPPLMPDPDRFLEKDIIILNIVKKGIGKPQRAPAPFDESLESQSGAGKETIDQALGRSSAFDHTHPSPATSKVGLKKKRESGAVFDKAQGLVPVIKNMCGGMGDVMDPQPIKKDTFIFIEHDLPVRRIDDFFHLPLEKKDALIKHLFVDHPSGCGTAEESTARAFFKTPDPVIGDDIDYFIWNLKYFTGPEIAFMKPIRLFEDSKYDFIIFSHVSPFLS